MSSVRRTSTIILLSSSPDFLFAFFLPHTVVIATISRAFPSPLHIRLHSLILYAVRARPRLRIYSLPLADARVD